ncbi:glycerophosphoryl diester phosphodiesterase membrane domain-containing protein [Boudabousia marimammalium]|uniref:DUF7847 domain-containing protein n=1 Tax=Boudabousia marimammalium TaxID=156892 RepID=A0A1Q5PRY8_9ACTO|nr:glycerophosphoryl diester phosphodiesterase membrane domain-containing protein [Boudabousia marimammalium]OKL50202.1 hypothetical protein BM477_02070 [Boudabousia marimammalium]
MPEHNQAENPWNWGSSEADNASPTPDTPSPASGTPASSYAPDGAPQYTPAPNFSQNQANQQPGIIPLRPLTISDLLEGSFAAVRSNPGVMFGLSVIVMSIVAVISGLANLWSPLDDVFANLENNPNMSDDEAIEALAEMFTSMTTSLVGPAILEFFAVIILTGLLTYAVSRAVIGKVTSLSATWSNTKGRVLPLIGLTILTSILTFVVAAVVSLIFSIPLILLAFSNPEDALSGIAGATALLIAGIFVAFAALAYISVKLLVAPIVLVLEGAGPIESIKRSWKLTKGFFWPTLGRMILIGIIVSIIGQVLGLIVSVPVTLGFATQPGLALALSASVGILVSGLILPVQAAYNSLIYVDLRIRKEGLATSLLQESANR